MLLNRHFISLLSTQNIEIISTVITVVCLFGFCILFLVFFRYYHKRTAKDVMEGKNDIEILDDVLYAEKESKKTYKKILKIFLKILSWLVLIFVAFGFIFSLSSRISGNNMMLGNSTYVVIASGSMETVNPSNTYIKENNLTNQIMTYDMVEIKKAEKKEDIQLYDVIAFKSLDGRIIVHRVVEILEDGTFVTKGDANSSIDTPSLYYDSLSFDNVIGIYSGNRLPVVGIFVIFLQSNSGIITIIALACCLLLYDYFHTKTNKAIDKREKALLKAINQNGKDELLSDYSYKNGSYFLLDNTIYQYLSHEIIKKEDITFKDLPSHTFNQLVSIQVENENEPQYQIIDIGE